jgi:hypothetical protein
MNKRGYGEPRLHFCHLELVVDRTAKGRVMSTERKAIIRGLLMEMFVGGARVSTCDEGWLTEEQAESAASSIEKKLQQIDEENRQRIHETLSSALTELRQIDEEASQIKRDLDGLSSGAADINRGLELLKQADPVLTQLKRDHNITP